MKVMGQGKELELRQPKNLKAGGNPFNRDFNPVGEIVIDNDTLEDFCVDVSVYSPLKFKERMRER